MKKIYVRHKETNEVYIRTTAFSGAKDGKVQIGLCYLHENHQKLGNKEDFVKVTKEDNPECFL